MTLRSPGALDHPKQQLLLLPTSPAGTDHKRSRLSSGGVADELTLDIIMPNKPKLLRTNSSKKVRALLSFKSWEQQQQQQQEEEAAAMADDEAAAAGTNDDDTAAAMSASEAATRVQKAFKGHRTRRSLADCAIVIEELWWKLCDSASLDRTSISFFAATGNNESAASRWVRAGKRIAKVGKGLAKDDKAQQLALRHWLEAIDPRHRYGHNLHLYYHLWFASSSTEPFFYWLDVGAGREAHHPACPRPRLASQLVVYLGTRERQAYQVVVDEGGRLRYLQSGMTVTTTDDATTKWIFVLSTARKLYVGRKRKGQFQHSSFLAGGATSAAGRLVARDGVLQAIWPYSGHYLPTEDNFNAFIAFLQDNKVDLTHVKRCSVDDDDYDPITMNMKRRKQQQQQQQQETEMSCMVPAAAADDHDHVAWTSGAGARIGCVRDYPAELQSRALEQVNLSPNTNNRPQQSAANKAPIPSPRPSPGISLSPRLHYMAGVGVRPPPQQLKQQQCLGIRPPAVRLTLPTNKNVSNGKANTITDSDGPRIASRQNLQI